MLYCPIYFVPESWGVASKSLHREGCLLSQ